MQRPYLSEYRTRIWQPRRPWPLLCEPPLQGARHSDLPGKPPYEPGVQLHLPRHRGLIAAQLNAQRFASKRLRRVLHVAHELEVLALQRGALAVDGGAYRVRKEMRQLDLRGLLERLQGLHGPLAVALEITADFAAETLERALSEELVGRLLVLADLAERHRARAETALPVDLKSFPLPEVVLYTAANM